MRGLTWLVLTRNATESLDLDGRRVFVGLVLDADTGLALGVSVAGTAPSASRKAMEAALKEPAVEQPDPVPAQVICVTGNINVVTRSLAKLLGDAAPEVIEAPPMLEAEDILDAFVASMSGRRPPEDLPTPADWGLLYEAALDYCRAEPWRARSDAEHLALSIEDAQAEEAYLAVVLGQEGIQRGLGLYPGGAMPPGFEDWQFDGPLPMREGTLLFWLNAPEDVPGDFAAKAYRYGWPMDLDLVPAFIGAEPAGIVDVGQGGVHRLAVGITAVLAHERAGPGGGTLALPDGREATYRIAPAA